jgi:hypothetical protein
MQHKHRSQRFPTIALLQPVISGLIHPAARSIIFDHREAACPRKRRSISIMETFMTLKPSAISPPFLSFECGHFLCMVARQERSDTMRAKHIRLIFPVPMAK